MPSQSDLKDLFHDVKPIRQDDGPHPVCVIAYSAEFREAMDYMRAILHADERSERALGLTALCLSHNPANYTIWHFRRLCLSALTSAPKPFFDAIQVDTDLALASKLGGSNPKNYQIWHHRRAMLEPLFTANESEYAILAAATHSGVDRDAETMTMAQKELKYVQTVLEDDAKNYHAWSHRQWIIRTINVPSLWIDEKVFAHTLILEDPRNNSAWNQRWFASHCGLRSPLLTLVEAKEEAEYAIQGAAIDPYNESPWRYFIGILKEQVRTTRDDARRRADCMDLVKSYLKEVLVIKEALVSTGHYHVDSGECTNLTSAHLDVLQLLGDDESLRTAADMAHLLGTEHDTIRKKYWLMREKELRPL